jgi:hypothetical protein
MQHAHAAFLDHFQPGIVCPAFAYLQAHCCSIPKSSAEDYTSAR